MEKFNCKYFLPCGKCDKFNETCEYVLNIRRNLSTETEIKSSSETNKLCENNQHNFIITSINSEACIKQCTKCGAIIKIPFYARVSDIEIKN